MKEVAVGWIIVVLRLLVFSVAAPAYGACLLVSWALRRSAARGGPEWFVIDDSGVAHGRGDWVDRVSWSELRGVDIVTTSDGPFAEDCFWLLHGPDETGVVVPNRFGQDVLRHVGKLPGFDCNTALNAMGTTTGARFTCWRQGGLP